MNDNYDPNSGPLNQRDNGNSHSRPRNDHTNGHTTGHGRPGAHANGHAPQKALDFWTIADILAQRWHWPVFTGTLGMVAFLWLGWKIIPPSFTATNTLLRYETPAMDDSWKTTPLTAETFADLITAPDLRQRIGDQVRPAIPPEKLLKMTKVEPVPNSDAIKLQIDAPDPQSAVTIANLYAAEAVLYTRNLQATQAAELAQTYLREQVRQMDEDIKDLRDQFRGMPVSAEASKLGQVGTNLTALDQALASASRPSVLVQKHAEKLQTALSDLTDLLTRYTEQHPSVERKQAEIDALKNQITREADSNPTGILTMTSTGHVLEPDLEIIRARLRSIQDARELMNTRLREAQMYAENPPGMVRVIAPATLKAVEADIRGLKVGFVAALGGGLGMAFGFLLLVLVEATGRRLKTADDVKRVTHLPVLTTLGDLRDMEEHERTLWAFRTWTLLQGRFSRSQHHGLVCGVTSSTEGEGRSTWISLMAEAASLSGFRVLTIATRPSPMHIESPHPDQLTEGAYNGGSEMKPTASENNQIATLGSNALSSPAQVTEQLTRPDSQPVVHIPLPGWVWNLDRRKEWQDALTQWRQIDNLVIFVELPPASVPEAVLLGSNLPNLIWLSDSGKADAAETRTQLETLRNARCNLVGAVLNREPAKSLKTKFPRWLGCLALWAALGVSGANAQLTNQAVPPARTPLPTEPSASATPPAAAPADAAPAQPQVLPLTDVPPAYEAPTNLSFSVVSPRRAPWQQRLTLGAGDVVNISLYGEPLTRQSEVAIGPDGRLNFLGYEVLAAGLTVDELRKRFDQELGKYYRAPRVIITPVAFKSKKYFVLGKVVQKGVYTLDRPITVIEAVARAKGFEFAQVEYNTVDVADLQRSFLMRGNRRVPVDFEKLFQGGDLSQNIAIEPGDYLYFPAADVEQVYVLGEVGLPGQVLFRPDLSPVGAIAARGGFSEKAYKSHVLVVRGSLNKPETFVVNVLGVAKGKERDFRLKPKDIVYVSWRPFYRAEDLLDLATTAFIQSAVATWVGDQIVKP